MVLQSISLEQFEIVTLLKEKNIKVNSVAGSGKTTTSLYVAKEYSTKNILLLTFNASLKIETRIKCQINDINNMEVHSFHSFVRNYYDHMCKDDETIIKVLQQNTKPLTPINYDIIIIDEKQDCNDTYYVLCCKIIQDNIITNELLMMVFGDLRQSIYQFNNADNRYLKYADQLYQTNQRSWCDQKLSTSFRITKEMSLFINSIMLKDEQYIISNKISNQKPIYWYGNSFGNGPYKLFLEVLQKYKPEEIYIIAPSVRSTNSPVKHLENLIKERLSHIMIYVSSNADEIIDKDIISGKLVISSYHQTKGNERCVSIVFSFDNSYFTFFNKDANASICPNEQYVATTRASDQLILIHDSGNDYLPYINKEKLNDLCDVRMENNNLHITHPKIFYCDLIKVNPSNITMHIPQKMKYELQKEINTKRIQSVESNLTLQSKIKSLYFGQLTKTKYYEDVCDINGAALPLFYECTSSKNQTASILNYHKTAGMVLNKLKEQNNLNNYNRQFIDRCCEKHRNINCYNLTMDEALFLANIIIAEKSNYLFKLFQIDQYNWINQNTVKKAIQRFQDLHLNLETCTFEKYWSCSVVFSSKMFTFNGYSDCYDVKNNILYEFKCTSEITIEHIIQTITYAFMINETNSKPPSQIFVFNVKTNELIEITSTIEEIKSIVYKLLNFKYINETFVKNDEDFLTHNKFLSLSIRTNNKFKTLT